MNLLKKKHPKTVLGLTFDGSRLEAVVLRRTNGHAEVQKTAHATLTLDLLHNEIELVGQEIRNQLDAAGIKERRCVVGVPLSWALTMHTKLPEMPEEDVASFVQIEAERSFPRNMDELQVATARHSSPSGGQYVTQIGLPREHLSRLEAVLEAAQLKPVSFTLGITALPGAIPEGSRGSIVALAGDASVEILIAAAGGVVAMRTLEGAYEAEGSEKRVQSELVARELRITLGQLPADISANLGQLRVFGAGRHSQQLADEIRPRAKALGLSVDQVTSGAPEQHGMKIEGDGSVSTAVSVAAQFLSRRRAQFEFLPPKPNLWQQFSSRYSSKGLVYAGATAAAAVALIGGLFLYQQIQLSSYGSEWKSMKPKVNDLDEIQQQIRKYRPWYDESLASLSILRRVTEAFPEDGAVSAKTVEIHNLSTVNVSGTAKDNAALLKTLDQLRAAKEVGDVRVDTIRGKSPMQFTFNFHWGESRNP